MGLFDIFTGDAYKNAAEQQRQYFSGVSNQMQTGINQARTEGLGALQSGQSGAIGAIQGGVGQARNDISQFYPQATNALYASQQGGADALMAGQGGALGAIAGGIQQGAGAIGAGTGAGAQALMGGANQARRDLASGVRGAVGAYNPLASLGNQYAGYNTQASNASADALGLNGPEGVARAQQSFQAGPGYNFAVDQGLEAISRNANASGMVASGNQLRESQQFGQGLANQEWGNYQSNLANRQNLYAPLAGQAVAGVAQGQGNALLTGGTTAANIGTATGTNLANLYSGAGTNLANLYAGGGANAANVYTGTGTNLANLYSGTGRAVANTLTGQGSSLADLASRGGLAEANAYQAGGQNQANLLQNLSGQNIQGLGQISGQVGKTYDTEAAGITGGSKNLWNLIGGVATAGASGGLGGFLKV